MKYKLAAIFSIALMLLLTSLAMAQDDTGCMMEDEGVGMLCVPQYWCFGTGYAIPGTPNIVGIPGQTITFTGSDASATYTWTFRDQMNAILKGPATGPTFAITLPMLCGKAYTVEWTATVKHSDGLTCITKGCIKIWVPCICVKCPDFPNYCTGDTPVPYPVKLVVPLPYTLKWTIDGNDAGTGDSPTNWDNLPVGTHTIIGKVMLGTATVKTCRDTLEVYPTPTGGASWV